MSAKPLQNFVKIDGPEWKKFSGHLSTSAQPGRGKEAFQDAEILNLVITKRDLSLVEDIISNLQFLDDNGVEIIYSLAHAETDRNPKLIQYLWQSEFNKEYITNINGVELAIKDFHAPTLEQLDIISDDIIYNLNNGKNILVHCAAGRGRTGTIIAATYMKAFNEFDSEKVINYTRNYIAGAVETKEQVEILELFSKEIFF